MRKSRHKKNCTHDDVLDFQWQIISDSCGEFKSLFGWEDRKVRG